MKKAFFGARSGMAVQIILQAKEIKGLSKVESLRFKMLSNRINLKSSCYMLSIYI